MDKYRYKYLIIDFNFCWRSVLRNTKLVDNGVIPINLSYIEFAGRLDLGIRK